jgi:4-amino-4-deoxy-L-arabinose transferase-like glycosyltransferase
MTMSVYLLLPEYHDRLAPERAPLLQALIWATCLAAVAAAAFVGEIKDKRWKRAAQLGLAVLLAVAVAVYWP